MEFDPMSTEFFEDPWEMYRWLREEAPVYHNERIGFWAVSRYDDCVEVHRDVATYTSTKGLNLAQLTTVEFGELAGAAGSMMIMMDPPMHDRMRKLVNRAFTPRRIAEWEPVVEQVIGDHLDRLAGAGAFDVTRGPRRSLPGGDHLHDRRRARGRPPADPPLDRPHARAGGRQPLPEPRRASRRRSTSPPTCSTSSPTSVGIRLTT